jgi:hypothetical protein
MVSKYQIAFWNLENLFDIENSPHWSEQSEVISMDGHRAGWAGRSAS